MLRSMTNVVYTQARGCVFCLHIGSLALFVGRHRGDCLYRLELFTPLHRFRWSTYRGYLKRKVARAKLERWPGSNDD